MQEGYELDEGVVNNAVKACCRAGRPDEAEAVLAKSLERGLVPEVSGGRGLNGVWDEMRGGQDARATVWCFEAAVTSNPARVLCGGLRCWG